MPAPRAIWASGERFTALDYTGEVMRATGVLVGLEHNRCVHALRSLLPTRLRSPVVFTGLGLGLVGLAIAILLRPVIPGRLLVDPLPMALMPAAIMRSVREGFAYFDLRSPLMHMLFAVGFGAGSAWLTVRREGIAEEARGSARVASGLGILVVAIREVDAVVVAFYYALSAFVSLSISAYAADRFTRRLLRRRSKSEQPSTSDRD